MEPSNVSDEQESRHARFGIYNPENMNGSIEAKLTYYIMPQRGEISEAAIHRVVSEHHIPIARAHTKYLLI